MTDAKTQAEGGQAKVGRRLGVLGGTFDPIHLGHLIFAEQAYEQLGLDAVIFLPAGTPPHKEAAEVAPVKHRLELVELAIAGVEHFEVCTYETERRQVSYTVETLAALGSRYPNAELVWLIRL